MTQTRLFHGRPLGIAPSCAAEGGVYDFLDKVGAEYSTLLHPAAFTMEECEAVRKEIDAPVFKNLFLTNKQQTLFFLLMLPADKPFKTKYLSSQLGCARLSFASAEHMEQMLHIHPGAVSPLGLIYDTAKQVRLIIDTDLRTPDQRGTAQHNPDRYACHPCVNTASVVMTIDELLTKVLPATGHTHTWVTLPTE